MMKEGVRLDHGVLVPKTTGLSFMVDGNGLISLNFTNKSNIAV